MMEREFVKQKLKEFRIQEFVEKHLSRVGHSHTQLKKTPLGDKIIIFASRPGVVVGKKGVTIKELTKELGKEFKLENPQIEINEVKDVYLDAEIVAEKIVSSLERYGTSRFKGVAHAIMEKVMEAGALGAEVIISGKVPGARAKSWRFYTGYLKKCGEVAMEGVRKAIKSALLKPGMIGVQVKIMPPDIKLPDVVEILKEKVEEVEEEEVKEGEKEEGEVKEKGEEKKEEEKGEKEGKKEKKEVKKKTGKKEVKKKGEKKKKEGEKEKGREEKDES